MSLEQNTFVVRGAQSAPVELTLAGVMSRSAAICIDAACYAVLLFVIGVGGYFLIDSLDTTGIDESTEILIAVLMTSTFLLQWGLLSIMAIAMDGASVGKQVFRLRVVSRDGSEASPFAHILRSFLLPIDLMVGPWIMAFSKDMVRLGDLAAQTVVIYEAPEPTWLLTDLPQGVTADEVALLEAWIEGEAALDEEVSAELAERTCEYFDERHPGYLPEKGQGASYRMSLFADSVRNGL